MTQMEIFVCFFVMLTNTKILKDEKFEIKSV
ncbi:hypothetical protein PJIAN_1335 [Paludibacter jiangxiensis]|uniref:Uncharacterized protein n=1 Tax=Paludibacter jiangxiensis TaxID=681398 RepID=A0A170YEV3_9BACT|nr:hypothetical protein PJIAN_1335 [Paludibacter jiangxiensis]